MLKLKAADQTLQLFKIKESDQTLLSVIEIVLVLFSPYELHMPFNRQRVRSVKMSLNVMILELPATVRVAFLLDVLP